MCSVAKCCMAQFLKGIKKLQILYFSTSQKIFPIDTKSHKRQLSENSR